MMAATKCEFYKSKIKQTWTESYPVRVFLSCDHQGLKDVTDHANRSHTKLTMLNLRKNIINDKLRDK